MKCKVYTTTKKSSFLIVPSETKICDLPQSIQNQVASTNPWKEIDLDPSKPLIALDPKEALKNIGAKGYHMQGTQILFDEIV